MLIEEVKFKEISPKFGENNPLKDKCILYWDISKKKDILSEIVENDKRLQHFLKILQFFFIRKENQYKDELYRKENYGIPNLVVAMKFLGNASIFGNLRIYCQEHKINGKYHIVMSRVVTKKGNSVRNYERTIISNVASEMYLDDIKELEMLKRPRRVR
ncbi:MAG: hypothetical protein K9N06_11705 [Candidatus Cloacimonetes bacterium]|nr:hypothetical protein [Candidatus Cloacimonadota bacterium]